MAILVIGALGLIGSSLTSSLTDKGHQVISIDSKSESEFAAGWKMRAETLRRVEVEKNCFQTHYFDPSKEQQVFSQVLDQHQVDTIVNVGGNSLATEFRLRDNLIDETMSSLNRVCAVEAERRNIRYIYISSSMIYGNFDSDPQGEDLANPSPIDPYGALKLGCEMLINSIGHQNPDFDFAILRPSAVYGALDTNERVLVKFLHQLDEGKKLAVKNPAERLDFTHVEDLAEMISLVVSFSGKIRETFNVSNGKAHSLDQAITAFRTFFSVDRDFYPEVESDIVRPSRGSLSMAKFQQWFGGSPTRSINEGIKDLVVKSKDLNLLKSESAQ